MQEKHIIGMHSKMQVPDCNHVYSGINLVRDGGSDGHIVWIGLELTSIRMCPREDEPGTEYGLWMVLTVLQCFTKSGRPLFFVVGLNAKYRRFTPNPINKIIVASSFCEITFAQWTENVLTHFVANEPGG